jgi:hypothetical protein
MMEQLMDYQILDPHDPIVERMLRVMRKNAPQSYQILFMGDSWLHVELVGVYTYTPTSAPFGIASLAPTDELGQGGPHIIGLWINPFVRRRGAGTHLLVILTLESIQRYGVPPTVVAVTTAGLNTAHAAACIDERLIIVDAREQLAPGMDSLFE